VEPVDMPDTTPSEFTVAIAVFAEDHVTALFVALEGNTVAISDFVEPAFNVKDVGEILTEAVDTVMVNAHVAVRFPLTVVARMIALPAETAVTTPDEFDELVAVRERAEYEAHAVTTETPLELEGLGSTPLMFVAHPPSVADATCELNDWRVAPADKERQQPGDGPNCELVRARLLRCSVCSFDFPSPG
jgi:hypothetical protein